MHIMLRTNIAVVCLYITDKPRVNPARPTLITTFATVFAACGKWGKVLKVFYTD